MQFTRLISLLLFIVFNYTTLIYIRIPNMLYWYYLVLIVILEFSAFYIADIKIFFAVLCSSAGYLEKSDIYF